MSLSILYAILGAGLQAASQNLEALAAVVSIGSLLVLDAGLAFLPQSPSCSGVQPCSRLSSGSCFQK